VLVNIANNAYKLAQEAVVSDPFSATMSLQLAGPYKFDSYLLRFLNGTDLIAWKTIEVEVM